MQSAEPTSQNNRMSWRCWFCKIFFFFKFIYSLNGFDLGGESGARYPLHGAHSSPSRTPQSADWWGKKQATKVNLLIAQGCGQSPFTGAGGDSSHVRHLARWPSGERSLKVFGAHTEAGRRGPRANRPSAALLKPRGSPRPEGSPGSSSSLCCAPRVGATRTHVEMVNSPLPRVLRTGTGKARGHFSPRPGGACASHPGVRNSTLCSREPRPLHLRVYVATCHVWL